MNLEQNKFYLLKLGYKDQKIILRYKGGEGGTSTYQVIPGSDKLLGSEDTSFLQRIITKSRRDLTLQQFAQEGGNPQLKIFRQDEHTGKLYEGTYR